MPALQIGYHDHCFDGVASAATFLRFYRDKLKPGLTDVGLRGLAHRAGHLFDADVFSGEENAVVDFRFSPDPRLTWWFDHHQSAFESADDEAVFRADRSGRKFWDPQAKSCTRFLARIAEEKFGWDPSPLRELIDWAEIIDGALFPSAQMAVALGDPPMRLMLLIEASKDPAVLPRLIRELSQRPLSTVQRNSCTIRLNRSGSSRLHTCPVRGRTTRPADGIVRLSRRSGSRQPSSSSPVTISVGTCSRRKSSVRS